MKANLIKKENSNVEFELVIEAAVFEKGVANAYQKTKGKYAIPGFRKGKVPKKILESRFGEDLFYEDAINDIFPLEYAMATSELKLETIDRPSIEVKEVVKGEDVKIIVRVEVKPEFELGQYKGVEVEKISYNVSDEDVEKELTALQDRNSRLVNVDRVAKEEDTVLIDYKGFVGEEQFEGGTAERQNLIIGSGSFVPGFEEQLIGTKAGEDKDVNVTFPEDYHENLSGKEAIFHVKVIEVKEKQMPEIDDEFAKDVSEFDTLDELKKSISEKTEATAKETAEKEQRGLVIAKVVEGVEIDVPSGMIETQVDNMVNEFDFQLKYQGLDLETYLKYLDKDMDAFREELKEDAEKKVEVDLTIEAITEAEAIEITEDEVLAEIDEIAKGYKENVEEFKEKLKAENFEHIRGDLKNRKAVDIIVENAKYV